MPLYQQPINGSRISEAYAEAMASAPLTRVMLSTYEFRHPNFVDASGAPAPIRAVNDFTDVLAQLEANAPVNPSTYVVFSACPVSVTGPEDGDTGATPTLSVTIDGVSGQISAQLDLALLSAVPVYLTERIYASDDLSGPARLPVITMVLRGITVNDVTVTASASFYDPANNTFPRKEYTAAEHPGLNAS